MKNGLTDPNILQRRHQRALRSVQQEKSDAHRFSKLDPQARHGAQLTSLVEGNLPEYIETARKQRGNLRLDVGYEADLDLVDPGLRLRTALEVVAIAFEPNVPAYGMLGHSKGAGAYRPFIHTFRADGGIIFVRIDHQRS